VKDHAQDDLTAPETPGPEKTAPAFKALSLDVDYYQGLLDDPGLSAEEREAFIRTLWEMICAFVDLGFQISPLQKTGGESECDSGAVLPFDAAAMVASMRSTTTIEAPAAADLPEERI
jgi:hypothetical protein